MEMDAAVGKLDSPSRISHDVIAPPFFLATGLEPIWKVVSHMVCPAVRLENAMTGVHRQHPTS
jgi:hypothetical protein